ALPAVPCALDRRRQRRLGGAQVLELVEHDDERAALERLALDERQRLSPVGQLQRRASRQHAGDLACEQVELAALVLLLRLEADDASAGQDGGEQEALADAAAADHDDKAGGVAARLEQQCALALAIDQREHALKRIALFQEKL